MATQPRERKINKAAGATARRPSQLYPKSTIFLLHVAACITTASLLISTFNYQQNIIPFAHAISIKPADFDRLIMPCYLGGSSSSSSGYNGMSPSAQTSSSSALSSLGGAGGGLGNPSSSLSGQSYSGGQFGRTTLGGQMGSNSNNGNNGYQPSYFAPDSGRSASALGGQARDGLGNLGQQVPRANTIDNFIALVSKIEAANPRLANNPDQLIRTLLGRFRMDNYYYDVRTRASLTGDPDRRTADMLLPALLNSLGLSQMQNQFTLTSDVFPEHLLDHDEKCSMYFMLSHFIDKVTPLNQPLSNIPISQQTGALGGQRPPSLQAAGTGYPGQSADQAFGGAGGSSRYPGPSPSFGSPATSNMNSFTSGVSNNPDYTGRNPYGMNVPQPNNQFNANYNNLRNTGGQYSSISQQAQKYSTPYIDGLARSRDERQALEFGVVTVGSQDNAALALNRVLLGLLAASMPPQTIRQLAATVYPAQALTNSQKVDEEIDPLYAVTLADLWAFSSTTKAGKPMDRILGDNGRWNDTMCPTVFHLERAHSIRFTTAELLGGLDGLNLGTFRRRLLGMRRNLRLSEFLKMYYSKNGFRPQFGEVGVCNRGSVLISQLEDLHRQAANYLRLFQLNLPTSDGEIDSMINRADSFKEVARQAANQFAPPEVCQDSSYNDPYPTSQSDQCEIAKADVVTVLDTSPQANEVFMNLVVAKLAQKIGLSRQGNSLSILTNQQDSTGYAGSYSFNSIVKNSTNTAEIGCALMHDTSRSYQGGQVTEPTRLVEMFEQALINLDSEYLIRQNIGSSYSSSSSYRQSNYVSSLFGQSDSSYLPSGTGPKNTGGAKVVIWFNYGPSQRQAPIGSSPTNWNGPNYNSDQNQYKFYEAKKYLRENYRGASILAVSESRDNVKAFVYDEDRDIFTDIPAGSGGSSSSADYYPSSDPSAIGALMGPADQLVSKLVQRMCDVPSLFQYPMCFRVQSEGVASVGYISPGRKQYWMMAPKTFFASRNVRMAFKVEGGRLRVCFGRKAKPDETAARNSQQGYQSGAISFDAAPASNNQAQMPTQTQSSSNNYYTGLEYGICKDVAPGQEIDFVVSDPCYKKPIAECEPFYFVIRESSNPGEGDPNYMCKDEGCKRLDQVKFTMTHTGVACSSAFKALQASWLIIIISILTALSATGETRQFSQSLLNRQSTFKQLKAIMVFVVAVSLCLIVQLAQAQQAGVYDFGQGRYGEKRGNFTPSEVLGIILVVMVILGGLALTIGLCYYVTKKNSRGMSRVEQDDY